MWDILSCVYHANSTFADDYERYRKQFGEPPRLPENYGELILFYESGYVPRKTEQSLTFPILKTDKFGEDDDKNTIAFARTIRTREGLGYRRDKT